MMTRTKTKFFERFLALFLVLVMILPDFAVPEYTAYAQGMDAVFSDGDFGGDDATSLEGDAADLGSEAGSSDNPGIQEEPSEGEPIVDENQDGGNDFYDNENDIEEILPGEEAGDNSEDTGDNPENTVADEGNIFSSGEEDLTESDFGDGEETLFTAGLEENGDFSEASRVSFHIVDKSGGMDVLPDGSGQPVNQNYSILGRGTSAKFSLQADLTAGGNGAEAKNLFFDLKLPIFYVTGNGEFKTTYDENDEELQKIPRDQWMYLGARIPGKPSGWLVDSDKTYLGTNRFTSSNSVIPGSTSTLEIELFFYGDKIPDNTESTIFLGGGYESYYENGTKKDDGAQVDPQGSAGSNHNIVYSNLVWEYKVEEVTPRNVLWDQYNYMVYKMSIKNVSDEGTSPINSVNFILDVPSAQDGSGSGWLRNKDVMKWFYQEGGEPLENKEYYDSSLREEPFVGIPGRGGVLIYDVTGISKETLDQWNLTSFINARNDQGETLPSLPYYFQNNNNISFTSDSVIGSKEEKTFYVAVPMPTSVPDAIKDHINSPQYGTIFFGNETSTYGWTKKQESCVGGFDDLVTGFTNEKYVLSDESNDHLASKDAAIGD